MAIPKFVLGINTLEFPQGIQLPSRTPRHKVQVNDRTAAGTLQVEDLGADYRRFYLDFVGLPKTKYAELETWWDTISEGAKNTFTYYDELANTHTVRLLTNPLDFPENRNGFLDGSLLLEVVS